MAKSIGFKSGEKGGHNSFGKKPCHIPLTPFLDKIGCVGCGSVLLEDNSAFLEHCVHPRALRFPLKAPDTRADSPLTLLQ